MAATSWTRYSSFATRSALIGRSTTTHGTATSLSGNLKEETNEAHHRNTRHRHWPDLRHPGASPLPERLRVGVALLQGQPARRTGDRPCHERPHPHGRRDG